MTTESNSLLNLIPAHNAKQKKQLAQKQAQIRSKSLLANGY